MLEVVACGGLRQGAFLDDFADEFSCLDIFHYEKEVFLAFDDLIP